MPNASPTSLRVADPRASLSAIVPSIPMRVIRMSGGAGRLRIHASEVAPSVSARSSTVQFDREL